MSKEYIEAFRDILGILSAVSGCEVDMNSERIITVKSALQRLEAIDNAEPSEALEWLEQFLNEMTYCLEHPKEYAKGYEKQIFWKFKNTLETTIKQALQRLEAIDNANPSEALECLERIDNTLCLNNIKGKLDFGIDDEEHTDCDSVIGMVEDLETIKQALLKAQEPKKYLKWEDLEFKEKEQTRMEVLLNGSRYLLEYYAVSEKEFVFIRARATKTIIFNLLGRCSTDKQFFNDLHLERVGE